MIKWQTGVRSGEKWCLGKCTRGKGSTVKETEQFEEELRIMSQLSITSAPTFYCTLRPPTIPYRQLEKHRRQEEDTRDEEESHTRSSSSRLLGFDVLQSGQTKG